MDRHSHFPTLALDAAVRQLYASAFAPETAAGAINEWCRMSASEQRYHLARLLYFNVTASLAQHSQLDRLVQLADEQANLTHRIERTSREVLLELPGALPPSTPSELPTPAAARRYWREAPDAPTPSPRQLLELLPLDSAVLDFTAERHPTPPVHGHDQDLERTRDSSVAGEEDLERLIDPAPVPIQSVLAESIVREADSPYGSLDDLLDLDLPPDRSLDDLVDLVLSPDGSTDALAELDLPADGSLDDVLDLDLSSDGFALDVEAEHAD